MLERWRFPSYYHITTTVGPSVVAAFVIDQPGSQASLGLREKPHYGKKTLGGEREPVTNILTVQLATRKKISAAIYNWKYCIGAS